MIHPSEPVLSAAAAAVLLTFAAASAAAMTPGVYSAAVPARNGELAVEVQVSADRIESVKVVRQRCRWKHKLMSSLWAAAEPAWWLQPPPSSAAPR